MSLTNAPDLTKQAPRSVRVTLGGYATLPRMIDKCRATIVGKNGEYHYDCPLDQRLLEYIGIEAEALKAEVATGKGDGEILEWITANAKHKRTESEIAQWSAVAATRAPDNTDGRAFFNEVHLKIAPKRTDISTWFELLDVDDFISYGGTV